MTFLTGPAAVLGEPSFKGHTLAAEEINAKGGLLGKRKIETITADESAGTDANVKEPRRMKLSENIDLFSGVISSGNSPALAPVAEELGILTVLTDGCTDFVFDKADPIRNTYFASTISSRPTAYHGCDRRRQAWPQVRKVASIHPDYSYGRNAAEHFQLALERLLPGVRLVARAG
jgi:branched-chain amino acid transport system substrate-binding protein